MTQHLVISLSFLPHPSAHLTSNHIICHRLSPQSLIKKISERNRVTYTSLKIGELPQRRTCRGSRTRSKSWSSFEKKISLVGCLRRMDPKSLLLSCTAHSINMWLGGSSEAWKRYAIPPRMEGRRSGSGETQLNWQCLMKWHLNSDAECDIIISCKNLSVPSLVASSKRSNPAKRTRRWWGSPLNRSLSIN